MSEQKPSPRPEERSSLTKDSRKRLQKREQRILERLQEAQTAQAKALERFQRAQARLQKRTQRVQRVESRLSLIRQQLLGQPQEAPTPPTRDTQAGTGIEEEQAEIGQPPVTATQEVSDEMPQESATGDVFVEEILLVDASEHAGLPPANTGDSQEQFAEEVEEAASQGPAARDAQRVQEAHAAAEAAEENARLAAERAADITTRIEQASSGRHLLQELLQAQTEAEEASAFAQQAARTAEEVEQEGSTFAETDAEAEDLGENQVPTAEVNGEEDRYYSKMEIEVHAGSPDEVAAMGEQEETSLPVQDSLLTQADEIAELEEEEEMAEAMVAKSIAEIAAERAASAEAIAEASSVQTREARRRVQEAEAALGQVRLAIRSGALSGTEADLALQNAENELTRASAFLADAEADEEQAVNNAMNAEAEAEVAEGMSYAASEREFDDLQKASSAIDMVGSEPEEDDELEDNTSKLPVVRPPESM